MYDFLRREAVFETPSEVLRRLLPIPRPAPPNVQEIVAKALRGAAILAKPVASSVPPDGAQTDSAAAGQKADGLGEAKSHLMLCISEQTLRRRNPTEQFLHLLSAAYRDKPGDFEKVLELKGRRRRYFGHSSREIELSGTSTHPRQIPGSPYWAMTNADTDQKQELLRGALRVLGYSSEDLEAAVNSML